MICNLIKHYLLAGLLAIGLSLFLTANNHVLYGQKGKGGGQNSVFVSEEGGFKVRFSAEPAKTVREFQSVFGRISLTQYGAKSSSGYQVIAYFDIPISITAEGIKRGYDNSRDVVLRSSPISNGGGQGSGPVERRLIEEKDFYLGERLGREILYEDENLKTVVHRFLLVERRMFQLIVTGTPRFSRMSESEQNSFRKAADKFFNSFILTKVSKPLETTSQLPADFGLKLKNNIFSSEYLGFTINLPQSMRVMAAEETKLFTALARADLAEQLSQSDFGHFSINHSKPLIMVIDNLNGDSFFIGAARGSFPDFKPLSLAKDIEWFLSERLGIKITESSQSKMFGGVEFARFEMLNETNLKQRLYVANRKDIALVIMLSFERDVDAEKMEAALQTIRFK